jgi:MYXO-CTERM domain-containing protein
MRRPSRTTLALAALAAALASCSGSREDTAQTQERIVYGTPDTAHTAVVAVLSPAPGGFAQCSGTIVQVCGGVAYVLTAAHCCRGAQPTVVVMGDDYGPGVPYISSPDPPPPAFGVIPGSVQWDNGYDPAALTPIDDFCVLAFYAPPGTPAIPVATGDDGLALGALVEYVGFGTTQDDPNNTLRRHASARVDLAVDANDFRYTEGGSTHTGGPCEGDSGGPALLPAGAPEAQQRVVGTTSYGDPACKALGVSMRVTSQSGPGEFIARSLAACGAGALAAATSSTSSGAVPSSSGGVCGFTTGEPACDACLTGSCCAVEAACAGDPICTSCMTSTSPPPACALGQALQAFVGCVAGACGAPCGAGAAPPSASSSSTGSGGAGTGGGGAGDGPAAHSGCAVASSSPPPSFAALLAAAALVACRRRRR